MSLVPRNIGARLALGYAIAVAVTVLVYAVVIYGFTRATLLEQLDARLQDDVDRTEHAFELAADGSMSWREIDGPFHTHAAKDSVWAEVLPAAGGEGLRWPEAGERDDGPHRIREGTFRLGHLRYRVRVGRSLGPVHHELAELRTLLALCLLPVVFLAWLVGHLLARRALRPVHEMTERAHRIGAERLSERLPVANPDDELGRLATVFNEAFARLEGSFDRLRRFTSDAAHEMRTPLAAIRTVGEVGLDDAGQPGSEREVIGSMLEETARLTSLVEQLLELTRGDAPSAAATEPVKLLGLARSVTDQLEVLAAEREQTLVVEGEEDVVVPAEAAALRRALMNVVDNAIRHGPRATKIRVTVGEEDGAAVISVTDEGPGIAEAHRAHVFERFYRVDPSRAGSGTGLGLSLAAQAVERQGGHIDLECPPDGGTTFRIRLALEARRSH